MACAKSPPHGIAKLHDYSRGQDLAALNMPAYAKLAAEGDFKTLAPLILGTIRPSPPNRPATDLGTGRVVPLQEGDLRAFTAAWAEDTSVRFSLRRFMRAAHTRLDTQH